MLGRLFGLRRLAWGVESAKASPAAVNYTLSPTASSPAPERIATGDLNGDGRDDIAAFAKPTGPSGGFSVLMGGSTVPAAPVFNAFSVFGPRTIAIADFNSDGFGDVALAGSVFPSPPTPRLGMRVYLGSASGTFTMVETVDPGPDNPVAFSTLSATDVNNDGKPDLVGGGAPGDATPLVFVALGNGAGGFGAVTSYPLPSGASAGPATSGDFNEDGYGDVALADASTSSPSNVYVLRGSATGALTAATSFAIPGCAQAIAAGKLDLDAHLDLAVSGCSGSGVSTLAGSGTGSLAGAQNHALGSNPHTGLAIADFNGDGRSDLAADNGGTRLGDVSVFSQSAAGALGSPVVSATAPSPGPMASGDFNGDGDDDLVLLAAGSSGSKTLSVLMSSGGIDAGAGSPLIDPISVTAPDPLLVGAEVVASTDTVAPTGQSIVSYRWDFDGNGSVDQTTSGPTATHRYDDPGTYTPRVDAVSSTGGTVSATTSSPLSVFRAPPAGPVGVTINHGAQYTNDPNVEVNAVWPVGSRTMLVSNDGGFQNASETPVAESLPWKLDSSGPERLPKVVYLRFDSSGGTGTLTDDIILDETPPTLGLVTEVGGDGSARVPAGASLKAKASTHKILIEASDKTSGVGQVQIGTKKSAKLKWLKYKTLMKFRSKPGKISVRVRDKAGNVSKWKSVKVH